MEATGGGGRNNSRSQSLSVDFYHITKRLEKVEDKLKLQVATALDSHFKIFKCLTKNTRSAVLAFILNAVRESDAKASVANKLRQQSTVIALSFHMSDSEDEDEVVDEVQRICK